MDWDKNFLPNIDKVQTSRLCPESSCVCIPRQDRHVLPATLEFIVPFSPCAGEDAFLATVVSEVNGAAVQFKLAPVYTLYMAARYRISKLYRPDISPQERAHRLTALLRKVAHMLQQTVQVSVRVWE